VREPTTTRTTTVIAAPARGCSSGQADSAHSLESADGKARPHRGFS